MGDIKVKTISFMFFIAYFGVTAAYAFNWTYKEHGRNWTGLCQTGKRQSPIDISDGLYQTSSLSPHLYSRFLTQLINYQKRGLILEAMSENERISIDGDKGQCQFGKHTFEAVEFHFHSPSEHTYKGKHFPLEMHIVHQDKHKNKAVIAVLFEKSNQSSAFLQGLDLDKVTRSGNFKHLHKPMGLSFLNTPRSHYFVYEGSMTTPPCTEGVKWFVLTKRHSISENQIKNWQRYDHAIKGSYRITQPLNFRVLQSF